ncbi:hypothetical protein PVK06_040699 [Gossypium arboreum]|uniref:Uncharacterized protein n=1 Tax=Gossypium arboreum TaxID=29729 RepID=A0ABR0N8D5_GOSAR|nr:hypothetical protein PVK06_040699 [Gossypium arboreum]
MRESGLQDKRFMLFQFGKYPLETTQSQTPIFETAWNNKENDSCNQLFEVSLPVSVSFLFLLQVLISQVNQRFRHLMEIVIIIMMMVDDFDGNRLNVLSLSNKRAVQDVKKLMDMVRGTDDMAGSPDEAEMVGKEMSKRGV